MEPRDEGFPVTQEQQDEEEEEVYRPPPVREQEASASNNLRNLRTRTQTARYEEVEESLPERLEDRVSTPLTSRRALPRLSTFADWSARRMSGEVQPETSPSAGDELQDEEQDQGRQPSADTEMAVQGQEEEETEDTGRRALPPRSRQPPEKYGWDAH